MTWCRLCHVTKSEAVAEDKSCSDSDSVSRVAPAHWRRVEHSAPTRSVPPTNWHLCIVCAYCQQLRFCCTCVCASNTASATVNYSLFSLYMLMAIARYALCCSGTQRDKRGRERKRERKWRSSKFDKITTQILKARCEFVLSSFDALFLNRAFRCFVLQHTYTMIYMMSSF